MGWGLASAVEPVAAAVRGLADFVGCDREVKHLYRHSSGAAAATPG